MEPFVPAYKMILPLLIDGWTYFERIIKFGGVRCVNLASL